MDRSDRRKAIFEHQSKLVLSSFAAAAQVKGDVIRMLFLINGGAMVALLALMGALAKSGAVFPDTLQEIVTLFGGGLVAAVVGAFFSWVFQDLQAAYGHFLLMEMKFETEDDLRKSWARGLAAMGLVIGIGVSLCCCVLAMNKSAVALSAIAKTIPPVAAPSKP